MKSIKAYITIGFFVFFFMMNTAISSAQSSIGNNDPRIQLKAFQDKVTVTIDGQLFTTYWQPEQIEKPILYPVLTARGTPITRGYPLEPRPGERVDHPHHIGIWLNHGNMNGLDFWNNSTNISPEKKHKYGSIRHRGITHLESGNSEGILVAEADWVDPSEKVLMQETTTFSFQGSGNQRWIDRTVVFTAVESVVFTDNKEGFFAIRVVRQLELPSEKPAKFIGPNGKENEGKIVDNEGVNGDYLNSEGVSGGNVWGKQADWVRLTGKVDSENISVTIFDHPQNLSYPSFWHARGYGLFSINSLGRKVFDKTIEEPLVLKLAPGESATFRYRIMLQSGTTPDPAVLNKMFKDYSQK